MALDSHSHPRLLEVGRRLPAGRLFPGAKPHAGGFRFSGELARHHQGSREGLRPRRRHRLRDPCAAPARTARCGPGTEPCRPSVDRPVPAHAGLHRRARGLHQPHQRPDRAGHCPLPQPVPRMDWRPNPRRRLRLRPPGRPLGRGPTVLPGRVAVSRQQRHLRGDVGRRPGSSRVHRSQPTSGHRRGWPRRSSS